MASIQNKRGIWYAVFAIGGRRIWKKLGKVSKSEAKNVLRHLEVELQKKNYGILEEKQVLFGDFADEYLAYSQTNKAKRTYERDVVSLKRLRKFFGTMQLPHITNHDIERYKRVRTKEKVSPRTVNIELRCLSNMFNKCVEWHYLHRSPFSGVKLLRVEKKEPRFLTREEITSLLLAAPPWLEAIIVVLLNTGLRDGERRRLQFNDIDFKRKRIRVIATKTNTIRYVPMNHEVEQKLRWLSKFYIAQNCTKTFKEIIHPRLACQKNYVFCNEDGSAVESIRKSFVRACKKANLENVTIHTLRHTFASHLVMSGVDLKSVQQLLGHSTITTTMIYAHLTPEHLAGTVEKLPWLKNEEVKTDKLKIS